jgi:hypothetical protein
LSVFASTCTRTHCSPTIGISKPPSISYYYSFYFKTPNSHINKILPDLFICCISQFISFSATNTSLTIPVAPAGIVFGINNDPAAVWSNFKTFFTFEEQSICRYGSGIQQALKRVAAEWVYLAQVTGIDKHSSFTVVLIMDQIDQLPGGTPVKIPFWLNVKVAVTLFELDLKIGTHELYLSKHIGHQDTKAPPQRGSAPEGKINKSIRNRSRNL